MYIILAYDISSKKGKKIAKLCELQLMRVQKSVFEGEISYKKLQTLKNKIQKTIDMCDDSVIIYYIDSYGKLKKESIGRLMPMDIRFL